MEDYSEKRSYGRYECNTQAYLYRYDDREQYYDAGIYNYSAGGNYLASNEEMDIGQQVYIKIQKYDETVKGPEKYEYYSGYVKWSDDLGTSSPGGQYGYGIEYAEPVYY